MNLEFRIKNYVASATIMFAGFLLLAMPVFAHVSVKPGEVGVGVRTNFVVSVPTEEDVPTTALRLVIPEGLQSVRPNAKAGWTIQLVKSDEGKEVKVTEIIWSGGNIPAEQRDEFVFSAMAPTEEKELVWKAYQTYADGQIVAWENDPKAVEEHTKNNPQPAGSHDESAPKPYSVTKVINDLKSSTTQSKTEVKDEKSFEGENLVAWAALALAAVSLGLQLRKRVG